MNIDNNVGEILKINEMIILFYIFLSEFFVFSEFNLLPEQRPPNIMPRGNVGTSTKFFLEAIRDCRLPAKLIGTSTILSV